MQPMYNPTKGWTHKDFENYELRTWGNFLDPDAAARRANRQKQEYMEKLESDRRASVAREREARERAAWEREEREREERHRIVADPPSSDAACGVPWRADSF